MADGKYNGYQNGPGPLPGRWLTCPRKSKGLLMNKFIAFKTPLDSKFDSTIPLAYRFTPRMFLDSLKSYNIKLSLWIDLTKTERFYNKDEITDANVSYVKIECAGHKCAPTKQQTLTFIKVCDNFIMKHPLDMIGVHCTHGFNRTGFLLIAYMVEKMDCSLEAALREFANVRPPGIYKEDYIRELYRRYDDEADAPPAPSRPSWCFDVIDIGNGPECGDGIGNSSNNDHANGKKRKFKPKYKENPIFMEGVPGVRPVVEIKTIDSIRSLVNKLAVYNDGGFVGSQPVSMDKNNLRLLSEKPYRVSWKADGTRYMMLIQSKGQIYFLDRDNSVFSVDYLQFFNRKSGQHLTNTLLDGEMVIDKVENKNFPRYLVYDIVSFEGNKIGNESFYPTRLGAIDVEIIKPRVTAMQESRIIKDREPFSVRAKTFYDISVSEYLLSEKFAKKLTHEPDGLIYQPSRDPYNCGQTPDVLKWKPSSLNTVDFLLDVQRETRVGYANQFVGILLAGKQKFKFGEIKCTKTVRALHGKIIECKFENNQWVLLRERTDKSFPNSYDTAKAVVESIRNPVTKDILLDFIHHHGVKELMPPPMAVPPKRKIPIMGPSMGPPPPKRKSNSENF